MSALRITKSYSKPLVLAASAAVAAGVIYFLSSRFVATSTTGSDSGLDYYSNPNSVLLGRASKDSEPTDAKINEDWTEDELRDWLEKVSFYTAWLC